MCPCAGPPRKSPPGFRIASPLHNNKKRHPAKRRVSGSFVLQGCITVRDKYLALIRRDEPLSTSVILTDQRATLSLPKRSKREWKDPMMIVAYMPHQGVLLKTFFAVSSAMQITLSIASTMNQRR